MPIGCVLGVDGGGTWTRCVVMSLDGRMLAHEQAGPSNPITLGVEQSVNNILKAVNKAKKKSGANSFEASFLGLAGASSSYLGDEMLERFPDSWGDTKIVSDAQSALAGATGCGPGVVVIAGTGSISYGINSSGDEVRAGGWGWLLGDEGSGCTIGRRAIIAALRAFDGSGPNTVLCEMILTHLGLSEMEEIIDWAYGSGAEPRHFASLVPLVKEAENMGDLVAAVVMVDAGRELGSVAQAVIKRLGLSGAFPVACSGGVFKQPHGYNESFEVTVREVAPDCVFIKPLFTPTVGSALLALRSLGVVVDDGLLGRVDESLRCLDE